MYRWRANCGILVFDLFYHEDRGLSQSSPSLERHIICAAATFSPAPACQSLFRDDAKVAETGLSYVGHDEEQRWHALVLRLGRQNPANRPSCNATVSTSVTIPAEFGPAARGPRLFSLFPCRLFCSRCVLHFPLLPRRCSSPLTPHPHIFSKTCVVWCRGEREAY